MPHIIGAALRPHCVACPVRAVPDSSSKNKSAPFFHNNRGGDTKQPGGVPLVNVGHRVMTYSRSHVERCIRQTDQSDLASKATAVNT